MIKIIKITHFGDPADPPFVETPISDSEDCIVSNALPRRKAARFVGADPGSYLCIGYTRDTNATTCHNMPQRPHRNLWNGEEQDEQRCIFHNISDDYDDLLI